ncbi:hypothetical protein A7X67_09510 [Clostridium sp. W14A]|nr:hypothetical protein A7X67_09510 [Clostridium sp. W14A]
MVMQFVKRYRELLVGISIGLFSVAYLIGSTQIRRTNIVSLGGEFMPELYGYFLLILSFIQIIKGLKTANTIHLDQDANNTKADSKNVFLVFVLITLYLAAMQFLGFILSSVILLYFLSFLLTPGNAKKDPVISIIYSLALPIITYFIFHNYMNINLPAGIIFI